MDRKQEYDTPDAGTPADAPALEGTLDRALDRRRARRRKLRPLRSLAAAAAVFVLLVNVSIPLHRPAPTSRCWAGWPRRCAFPTACPPQWSTTGCKRWSRPSATTAIPLTLEDLIVDQKQIHLFYTLDWEGPGV